MSLNFPFGFLEPPETTKPPAGRRTASRTLDVINPLAYGHGMLRPFVRDGQGDWAHTSDISVVRANVGQVLGTLASSGSSHGELRWKPEFGSLLHLLRFRNLDETTAEMGRTYVVDALTNWLTRIRVKDSSVVLDYDNTRLVITIVYDVLASNRHSTLATGQSASVAVNLGA
jgi:phage baseplate assembly protein W